MSSISHSTHLNRKSEFEDGEINEGATGTTIQSALKSRNLGSGQHRQPEKLRGKHQRSGFSENNEERQHKKGRYDDDIGGYYRHHRRNSRDRSSSQQRHSTFSRHHRDNDDRNSHHRHRHQTSSYDHERRRSRDKYCSSGTPTYKLESTTTATISQHAPIKESRENLPRHDDSSVKEDGTMDYDLEDEEDEKQKEERLIEERRKRRQAILDKYKSNTSSPASPSNTQNLSLPNTPIHLSKQADDSDTASSVMGVVSPKVHGGNGNEKMDHNLPDIVVSITDRDSSIDSTVDHQQQQAQASPVSPATKQELLRQKDHQENILLGEGIDSQRGMKATDYTEHLEQETKKPLNVGDEGFDMFATDMDIFADAEQPGQPIITTVPTTTMHADINPTLNDNWDDPEGYYNLRIGEVLYERYQTLSHLGKGVFSSVVKAKDLTTGDEVAIKMIRNNETMYKAGQKELALLRKLMDADPDNKKHVIRLLRHFEHRNHLCLVFESLSMNLRDVLKKYGKDVGISIKAVRVYAQQLFLSLSLLKRCSLLHADIKPDNILVTESKNVLKLCDLGSASDASDNEITPYLVSRFYRAPEIILGLPYDYALDVWSAACTLYELFTGKILFPGRSNNQMLKYMMEVKGRFSNKMLRKSQFSNQHFDDTYTFMSVEQDKLSGKTVVKKLPLVKPSKDIKSRIMSAGSVSNGLTEEENRLLLAFVDFLEKCLVLAPDRRMTAKEALTHPFITGKI